MRFSTRLNNSREFRMAGGNRLLQQVGEIQSIDALIPHNALRGTFFVRGTTGDLRVFFSLSPERDARVQALGLWVLDKP